MITRRTAIERIAGIFGGTAAAAVISAPGLEALDVAVPTGFGEEGRDAVALMDAETNLVTLLLEFGDAAGGRWPMQKIVEMDASGLKDQWLDVGEAEESFYASSFRFQCQDSGMSGTLPLRNPVWIRKGDRITFDAQVYRRGEYAEPVGALHAPEALAGFIKNSEA